MLELFLGRVTSSITWLPIQIFTRMDPFTRYPQCFRKAPSTTYNTNPAEAKQTRGRRHNMKHLCLRAVFLATWVTLSCVPHLFLMASHASHSRLRRPSGSGTRACFQNPHGIHLRKLLLRAAQLTATRAPHSEAQLPDFVVRQNDSVGCRQLIASPIYYRPPNHDKHIGPNPDEIIPAL